MCTFVKMLTVDLFVSVLKYWFDAVKTGVIPESGNTLVTKQKAVHFISLFAHVCHGAKIVLFSKDIFILYT